jgi:tRNA U34 2-thiouridine synthase MnmA/TrmU
MHSGEKGKVRAVALISGGLDSMLAARIVQLCGVEVVGLHLYTGLCITEHKRRVGTTNHKGEIPQNPALKVAERLQIPLEILDISETYLQVITHPKYGRGAGVNPCKDCRIHMFQYAFSFMREVGAEFLVTGEVVGQRPMSQVYENLKFIHDRTEDPDRILLPLSARLLPPTYPERMGWVDREKLYGFSGRSRKPQIELAKKLGFEEWEQPAGGCCFLTDLSYAKRFKDLFQYDSHHTLTLDDVVLLGVGRHFRLSPSAKLIVGRNEGENRVIALHRSKDSILLYPSSRKGPTACFIGKGENGELDLALKITARYCDDRVEGKVKMEMIVGETLKSAWVSPLPPSEVDLYRI